MHSTIQRPPRVAGAGVTAVLGPTNTGKTHLAIERMLAHSSGLIGLPLRLLAREVYTRISERVGAKNVALITGEEKIKPDNPRYWVSTVEAMPSDLDTAFVAIDEIQLGANLERGHIFTDRILNRRGREETLLLGAATMKPIIERLLPGASVVTRPRLSQLTFAGDKKLTRLSRRTAIVAFSAEEVYAIAELIRRQRGGAAVVLGSLSPRTRNAQVELYQSGDVEYLVATDAIGMGLNLDVDHVAFASDRKFDGYQYRTLTPAETAQIAGRAGRATRDGTFGTTGRCAPFEGDLVEALEAHRFEPVKLLQWRNSALDFSSLGALQASLSVTPDRLGLTRAPLAEDILVLEHAARDADLRGLARSRTAVERLWEVCQVPDYRKVAPANHTELVATLYGFLMREGKVPADWMARQVAQAERTDGDIDTLSNRIAHVRTWTFVANRADWLDDPLHWQGITRAVEDKLSDALHERLTARFVDRRTSVLMRRLRENSALESQIAKTGEVSVEGHVVGRLEGFRFAADPAAAASEARTLVAAAQKALAAEIDMRAQRLAQGGDEQFALGNDGTLRWTGDAVGKLAAGDEMLKPRVRILADEQLSGASRDMVQEKLDKWLAAHVEKLLGPLQAISTAEDVTGLARGVAFQLVESLGVLDRQKVAEDVKALDQNARAALRKYGVRFGAYNIYIPALLKPAPRALAVQLYALKNSESELKGLDDVQTLAASGRTSLAADKSIDKALYRAAGYRVSGERAVRVDILERLADLIRPALAWREGAAGEKPAGAIEGFGFTVSVAMTSLVGSSGEDFASILRSLGYRMDRKPKPLEAPAAVPSADAPAVAPDGEAAALPATAEGADIAPGDTEPPAPDMAEAAEAAPLQPAAEAAPLASDEIPAVPASAEAADIPVGASEPAAPEMIEVWRPGRVEGRERPRHRGRKGAPQNAVAAPDATAPATADGETAAAAAPAQEHRRERHGRSGQQENRGRDNNRPRHERGGKGRRPQGDSKPQRFESEPRRERAERQPDPNSPFAKLAALKAQLEGKDGR